MTDSKYERYVCKMDKYGARPNIIVRLDAMNAILATDPYATGSGKPKELRRRADDSADVSEMVGYFFALVIAIAVAMILTCIFK